MGENPELLSNPTKPQKQYHGKHEDKNKGILNKYCGKLRQKTKICRRYLEKKTEALQCLETIKKIYLKEKPARHGS